MIDITGKAVQVGDTIVFNKPGHKSLVKGVVLKLTPAGCRALYERYRGCERDTFVENRECVLVTVRCEECVDWDDKSLHCTNPGGMCWCGEKAAKEGFCCFGRRAD